MHPFFSVTLFTGQQLVLEAIQRWLTRPCTDPESQRQRRLGLKGLLSLLVRTAATGVLATVLDAAIEFRRRQLLAAAAADPEEAAAGGAATSRFPGLGMLSRAGVATWKSRLLLCIDELERRAEAYGIESRRRFSPGKPDDAEAGSSKGGSRHSSAAASTAAALRSHHGSCLDLNEGEAEGSLGRTVEQLRELVKQGDEDSQRRLDDEVGSLVDLLLGTASLQPPTPPSSTAPSAARSRSASVPAALNCLGGRREGGSGTRGGSGSSSSLRASCSRLVLAGWGAVGAGYEDEEEDDAELAAAMAAMAVGGDEGLLPASPNGSSGSSSGGGSSDGGGCCSELCHICMDRTVRVQVAGCRHNLCFGCARRLCNSHDHLLPQCPFCRQPINGFVAIPAAASSGAAADAGAVVAAAAAAPTAVRA